MYVSVNKRIPEVMYSRNISLRRVYMICMYVCMYVCMYAYVYVCMCMVLYLVSGRVCNALGIVNTTDCK